MFIVVLVWMYTFGQKFDILNTKIDQILKRSDVKVVDEERSGQTPPVTLSDQNPTPQNTVPLNESPVPHYTPEQIETVRRDVASFDDDPFTKWVKKDFMVKLGAFLFLLALGWFVSFAFANNWIGPVGRITLGILLGVTLLWLGTWRIEKYTHQGSVFVSIGSATILLSIFAAREIYGYFTPVIALGIMFASVVYVAFVSVKYDQMQLALMGLVLAGISPLLIADHNLSAGTLFTYLLVVVIGTLWVVNIRRWSTLTLASLIMVVLYGFPYLLPGVSPDKQNIALLFSFVFSAIFFIANIIGVLFNEHNETKDTHIAIGLGTGMYLVMWILGAASAEWQSLLCVAWMLVFMVGSYMVFRHTGKSLIFYIYSGISFVLLGVATAVELDSEALTVAFAIEVTVAVMLAARVLNDHSVTTRVSLLFTLPIILSMYSLTSQAWMNGMSLEHFFVLIILTLTLAIGGLILNESGKRNGNTPYAGVFLLILAALYGLTLIWRVTHAVMANDVATMWSLIVYTMIGIPLFVLGRHKGEKVFTWSGGILVGLVIGRLLLVEVWNMAMTERIIAFFVIGLLLMSTAFIKQKNNTVIDS